MLINPNPCVLIVASGSEADALIDDIELKLAVGPAQRHYDLPHAGMFHGIGDGLLQYPEQSERDFIR